MIVISLPSVIPDLSLADPLWFERVIIRAGGLREHLQKLSFPVLSMLSCAYSGGRITCGN